MSGKGCKRRPRQVSREEEDLRMDLAYGKISRENFDYLMKELKESGKITRSGREVR